MIDLEREQRRTDAARYALALGIALGVDLEPAEHDDCDDCKATANRVVYGRFAVCLTCARLRLAVFKKLLQEAA